ncbi:ubiquitin-like modifier 1 [Crepidotus variabilis]|uniref:Ubiquitin-related modifier 1 n=1 Tax=Crepidotus variabilis TaxID=179855 RepID=A0A9P6EL79_9AGAR|nr:ubiquitin-like modifier 1 [Crepidotus variabilis]
MSQLSLKVEFGGGIELLFSKKHTITVELPALVPTDDSTDDQSLMEDTAKEKKPANLAYLVLYLRDRLLTERAELFVENGTVRPGILVLVNDTDWQLEGEGDYELKDKDNIVFISTLHGG